MIILFEKHKQKKTQLMLFKKFNQEYIYKKENTQITTTKLLNK